MCQFIVFLTSANQLVRILIQLSRHICRVILTNSLCPKKYTVISKFIASDRVNDYLHIKMGTRVNTTETTHNNKSITPAVTPTSKALEQEDLVAAGCLAIVVVCVAGGVVTGGEVVGVVGSSFSV